MRPGSFWMQRESEKGMAVNRIGRNLAGLALFAGAVIYAVSAASQSAPEPTSQAAPQPAPQAAAQPAAKPDTRAQVAGRWKDPDEVYDKICIFCHDTGIGPELKGRKYPSQVTIDMVRVGPGAMPAFRGTDIDDAMLKRLGDMLEKSTEPEPMHKLTPGYIAPPPSITAPVNSKTNAPK